MFDKIFQPRQRHEHTHHTVIEERRAPLDQTVGLLRSMEQSAERHILDSMRVDSNVFKCSWLVFPTPARMAERVVLKFRLNEKDYELDFEVDVEPQSSRADNTRLVARAIHERVTRELASILMLSLFTVPTGRQLTEDLP